MLGFSKQPGKKQFANIGCGHTYHDDWDNFDLQPTHKKIQKINLNEKLNFSDNQYQALYCSHVLEHLDRSRVPSVLEEFARILVPGGVCRIVVPDLEQIARQYLAFLEIAKTNDSKESAELAWMTLELLDQLVRKKSGGFMGNWLKLQPMPAAGLIRQRIGEEAGRENSSHTVGLGTGRTSWESIYQPGRDTEEEQATFFQSGEKHQWMYDQVSLKNLLQQAGFSEVKVCGAGQSDIENFSAYYLDTNLAGKPRKPDSLYMEGRIHKA